MPVEQAPVCVVDITSDRDKIIGADKPKTPNLGGTHSLEAALAEANIAPIIKEVRRRQRRVFELTWEGNRIPSGAEVLGKRIAWTQHGMVTAEDGEIIGTYDRIEDSGGSSGKSQRMHVFVTSPKLLGADGEVV